MFDREENLRDTSKNGIKDTLSLSVPYQKNDHFFDSYPRLNKLITALYIVTDIIDKDEPVRTKLRTLGANLLTDIGFKSRTDLIGQVHLILSFLDISLAVRLISEMNFNILKKEFTELSQALEGNDKTKEINNVWLKEFLEEKEEKRMNLENKKLELNNNNTHNNSKGEDRSESKKERRGDILKAIREQGGSATITDIKNHNLALFSKVSEKTLQRELIAMVGEGILAKLGEKRWSKYSLKLSQ